MELKQEVKVNLEMLDRVNQGYNFLNIDEERQENRRRYYINVFLEIKQNLKEEIEEFEVKTNLGFVNRWCSLDVEDFLKNLDEFSKKLLLKVRKTSNRKNVERYDTDISNFQSKFRDRTILFSDVEINIGELAERKLKEINLDFGAEVKKILKQQQQTDKSKQKLMDRFVYLKEKVLTLKTFLKKQNNYYCSNKREDNTLKIMITPQEYNQNLKAIETEMKVIAKVFELELRDLDYLIIEQKVDFDKWLEVNKIELQENYNEYIDESDENIYGSFNVYAQQMYNECGGVVEVQDEEQYL